MTGTVFRIARYAVHDGPGIRTTVFLKGCPLRCWWCHSPESQSPKAELIVRPDRCARCGTCLPVCPHHAIEPAGDLFATDRGMCEVCGTCVRECPSGAREIAGTELTVDQLMAEIEKDVVFFDESGGGVTFSGGEPLMQPDFLDEVLRRCQAVRIHTAVDTCGLADREVLLRISPNTDLFLFDLKLMDEGRHREVTGASNQRILENLRMLAELRGNIRIRFPLVPGINDDPENVRALGALVSSLGLTRVDVLPYHRAGIAKYVRLDAEYRLPDTQPPSSGEVADVVAMLEEHGLRVQVGG
jgi:pyruvate formate lyase activating enzyme